MLMQGPRPDCDLIGLTYGQDLGSFLQGSLTCSPAEEPPASSLQEMGAVLILVPTYEGTKCLGLGTRETGFKSLLSLISTWGTSLKVSGPPFLHL